MEKHNPLLKIRIDGRAVDLVPQGTPISQNFWNHQPWMSWQDPRTYD